MLKILNWFRREIGRTGENRKQAEIINAAGKIQGAKPITKWIFSFILSSKKTAMKLANIQLIPI